MARTRMSWNSNKAVVAANGGGVAGLRAAMEVIKAVADQFVPYDQGTLAESGEVTLRENTSHGATIRLTYHAIYGAFLHLHPEYHFQRGRRARWLEKANTDTRKAALAKQASELQKSFAAGSS